MDGFPRLIYHGTSVESLETILSEGLVPRGDKKTNWRDAASRPDLNYLTSSYPFFFGRKANSGGVLVLQIDSARLDPDLLLPDEDFIVLTRQVERSDAEDAHSIAKRSLEEFQGQRTRSVELLGTCGYRGVIPIECITQYCTLNIASHEGAKLWYDVFYVNEISLEVHAKHGQRHAHAVRWAFGDEENLPDGSSWDESKRGPLAVVDL